jgi:hypothetical protein
MELSKTIALLMGEIAYEEQDEVDVVNATLDFDLYNFDQSVTNLFTVK